MKKILALAVGMLLIPFTAFGMEAMSDSDMDSITGQSGVAISLDNINIYQYEVNDELWFSAGDGAIGLIRETGNASMLYLNVVGAFTAAGVTDTGGTQLLGAYHQGFLEDTKYITGGFWSGPQVLSIKVGLYGSGTANVTAVEIGLPTLEIFQEQSQGDSLQLLLTSETGNPLGNTAADADTHSFGTLWTNTGDNSTTTILNGGLFIMPYSAAETSDIGDLTYTP